MQLIPLADEISEFVTGLTHVPRPSAPREEPPFTPLVEALPQLLPKRGEAVVISGSVPIVRMLIARFLLTEPRDQRVLLDKSTYAGPSPRDLVTALSGIADFDDGANLDRLLGATTELGDTNVALMASEASFTALPSGADLVVVEADRFRGGLEALAQHAARTQTRAIVPQDEVEELASGAWRTVRLRFGDDGAYPSGRFHVIATFSDSEARVRLAFASGSGRFL